MLTLLCTAPSSSVGSPIETFPPTHLAPAPPPSSGGAGPSSSLTRVPGRKLSIRRPSIRKRIQSITRASGTSLDKATTTPSNAAGKSTFSFFRHALSGSRSSASAGNVKAASTSGSVSAHIRAASTSSFMSGKSGRSNKSSGSSGDGHGRGGRLNVLNIGPPTAFKHQFHLGPDSTRKSDGPCDETRWRQVGIDHDDIPVIDVVPPTTSTATTESRKSISSERRVAHSRSPSAGASASSPNLLSVATVISTSNSSPSSSSSPSPASASTSTTSTNEAEPDKAKTAKQAKRTSLVKRKPVPKLDPEELESLPRAASPSAPAPAAYVLVPDPIPGQVQTKVPETAPAGKTSFEVQKSEEVKDIGLTAPLQKETSEETKEAGIKEEAPKESFVPSPFAPEHIYILHPSPAPTPPPRRHTLAHMQARALGRGMRDAPSLTSVPSVTPAPKVPASTETQEKKEKKPRPMPIVAPSAAAVEPLPSPIIPLVPPGLSAEERENASRDEKSKKAKPAESPNVTLTIDNSPRPSLSSLAPSSEGSETARSAGSGSSTESGELDLDVEPRTPTDEKRSSAGSASFIKPSGNRRAKGVRIVLPGDFPDDNNLTEDEDDEAAERGEETPRVLRRASKRPNPPVRRAEANEESVYVTADEADDV